MFNSYPTPEKSYDYTAMWDDNKALGIKVQWNLDAEDFYHKILLFLLSFFKKS